MLRKFAAPLLLFSPDAAVAGGAPAAVADAPQADAVAEPAEKPDAAPAAGNDDPWSELDSMAAVKKAPAKPADDKGKPADKPAADPKAKPADKKPDDKPAAEPAADDKEGKTFQTPKALREHAKRLETDLKTTGEKAKALEAKIADYEKRGADTSKLTERLAAIEKERDEFKAQVWEVKFERSDEFQTKYEKPFQAAANSAKALVEGLEVQETDGEGNTTTRKATWQDFSSLYAMPLGKSIAAITKLFGPAASIVSHELLSLQKLDKARGDALTEASTQREQRMKAEEAKSAQERATRAEKEQGLVKLWTDKNKEIAEKNPEYFLPDPKDKEAAAILQKSYELLDQRYGNKDLPVEKQVEMDAQIRNRAAAHPLMVYRLNKASERIAELEAQIAEMTESEAGEPPRRPGGHTQSAAKETNFDDELKKLEL
jgi:hypothetical protein